MTVSPDSAASLDPSPESVRAAFAAFEDRIAVVERDLARGHLDAAAVHAEIAAAQAYWDHPGTFTSDRLESLVRTLATRASARRAGVGDLTRDARSTSNSPRRVLHVLTQATGIGGHTRMVWRWIGLDRERSHSIVLTRQGAIAVPGDLSDAAEATRGAVHVLNRRVGGMLTWANSLRDLARGFDLVILHVFAGDVVAFLAFSDRRGMPPTAFVDQADHAFWIGRSYIDLLVGLRRSGLTLARSRRGVPASRTALLPIVLPGAARTISRDDGKRRLGIDPGQIVALTVARELKFRPAEDKHFLDTVVPVLRARTDVVLLAVGPDPTDARWIDAARQTDGRVRALGAQPDPSVYREAADLYLDSYPIVSTTSLLEAAAYGIPVVTRCPHPGECDVLCADAPGLEHSLLRATDEREHIDLLDRLIRDHGFRARAGAAAMAEVLAAHTGEGWLRSLDELYVRALNAAPADAIGSGLGGAASTARFDVLCSALYADRAVLQSVISGMIRALPLRERVLAWVMWTRSTHKLQSGLLLSEWLHAWLRSRLAAVFR